MNEGVRKNVAEKCIPLDYFLERLLQVGLCRSMSTAKAILATMLQFDNAGFTNPAAEEATQRRDLSRGGKPDTQREFVPLEGPDSGAQRFLRANLDRSNLRSTDRVSLNQFLGLFNVIGVENAHRVDRLVEVLKRKVAAKQRRELLEEQRGRGSAGSTASRDPKSSASQAVKGPHREAGRLDIADQEAVPRVARHEAGRGQQYRMASAPS